MRLSVLALQLRVVASMGWINAAFGGLFLVVIGGFLLLGLIGAAGAASSSSNHFTELVSTLALF